MILGVQAQDPSLSSEPLWAHQVGLPEQGGLLIASSECEMCLPQHLGQAVVFILEHSTQGTVGLILNRPSMLKLERTMLRDDSGESRLRKLFAQNRLYFGGESREQVISVLHGYKDVGGTEIVPGIYLGGHDEACDAVESGRHGPEGFKFFSGCMMWKPGSLQGDIDRGAWHVAAASRAVILKQCLSLPVPLWAEVLRLCGGEYAAEAARVYGDS